MTQCWELTSGENTQVGQCWRVVFPWAVSSQQQLQYTADNLGMCNQFEKAQRQQKGYLIEVGSLIAFLQPHCCARHAMRVHFCKNVSLMSTFARCFFTLRIVWIVVGQFRNIEIEDKKFLHYYRWRPKRLHQKEIAEEWACAIHAGQ